MSRNGVLDFSKDAGLSTRNDIQNPTSKRKRVPAIKHKNSVYIWRLFLSSVAKVTGLTKTAAGGKKILYWSPLMQ